MSLAGSLRFSSSRMRKTSVSVERRVSVGDSEIWPDEPNAMVQVRATKNRGRVKAVLLAIQVRRQRLWRVKRETREKDPT
jgi:hypothetical protein